MRSRWSKTGPYPMIGVLIKREKCGGRHHTGKGHVKRKAEIEVVHL